MRIHTRRGAVVGAFSVTLFVTLFVNLPSLAQGRTDSSQGDIERAIAVADDLSLAFEHVADRVKPSVVNVRSTVRIAADRRAPFGGGPGSPFGDPFRSSPFREFFGDDFFERFGMPGPGGGPQPRQPREFLRQGQGTGFVVSADGYILTNNHVVANATEITVQFARGREYRATLVGADPSTDLAVLKVDADGLVPLRFGDSDALRVGSWVVAVGNPFGLESTITAGIVSAKGRSRVGIADYEDFIQTDAAINPGNSGGPLVNLRGEVVGVNTAIATRTGGNMGIGFAIPSNMAMSIMENLRVDGVVTRGWLGVGIQDLDDGLAESFGFASTQGVLISQVEEGSPAAAAGLKIGDIVTHFDGVAISGGDQLRLRVASTAPGRTVPLTVFREGTTQTRNVTIGRLQRDDQRNAERDEGAPDVGDAHESIGMTLRNLDERTAAEIGAEPWSGILVSAIDPTSLAARGGIRAGEVITHVHDQRVTSVGEFRKAMRDHDPARGIRFTIRSGNAQRFVFLRGG